MPTYEDLDVYQSGLDLSSETWEIVRTWTYFHKDILGKQIVRSADSIPANVAEGYGRYTFRERIRFCHFARGSLFEYKTHLTIARRRELIDKKKYEELVRRADKVGTLLTGFIRYLRTQMRRRARRPSVSGSEVSDVHAVYPNTPLHEYTNTAPATNDEFDFP